MSKSKKPVKSNKAIIVDAIVTQIEKGKSFGTVLALNGTKWNLPRTTFARYWKIANEKHQEAQQVINDAKAALDLENALNERKSQIADVLERKEILTQILRGQMETERPMVVNGELEQVKFKPDYTDIKAAIAELNKMEGSYAPVKNSLIITKLGADLEDEEYV